MGRGLLSLERPTAPGGLWEGGMSCASKAKQTQQVVGLKQWPARFDPYSAYQASLLYAQVLAPIRIGQP
jgi:hypothetical protein